MKPLFVLLGVWCISTLITKFINGSVNFNLSARIAMCAMLIFTAIAHFVFTPGMAMMLPRFIPYKSELVYLTGVMEIVLGVSLLVKSWSYYSGWVLIAFFIILLPANISASIRHIDYQNATTDGMGPGYLWFRIPLQLFFISWVYLSCIYNQKI